MIELSSKQCTESPGDGSALGQDETEELLSSLEPRWQLGEERKSISFTFTFDNYYQTMAFVNVVAQIAHQQNHHPELLISYRQCNIRYSTHSVGGLSVNDFICAAKINIAQKL
ncbi:MAG TPA: 4a-hydroxytetrahydrobiopterin dehydratase [Gammaproteobacteria bacterium]|nr:4a-hydroxytetrahydrobiopterin dehydratase [Gammaproteobacteria bacterium]